MKGSSQEQQGFISTTFLIVLCLIMAIVAVKSDYIVKANEVYCNLREAEETFAKEAAVIGYVKCVLARNEELHSFEIGGIAVDVYETHNGYDLYFGGKKLEKGAYVEVSLLGNAPSAAYEKMTDAICTILDDILGIPGKSVYVTYHGLKDWGWNGSNF